MKQNKGVIILIVAAVVFFLIATSVYTVDERKQVVITQFGRVVGEPITDPGLYFKIPFIHKINYFPKNLLGWDGDPGQIPTLEKTYIWVDTFARWKIVDPVKFFQTVNNVDNGLRRLDDIIDPAVRNAITSHRLIEAVRTTNRAMAADILMVDGEVGQEGAGVRHSLAGYDITVGREELTRGILAHAQPRLDRFGIELVDVKIKRINYVEEVRRAVYGRMIAERRQVAEEFRSEGRGGAKEIIGEMERELKLIGSGAYRTAQEIKGEADAKATVILSEAHKRDPEFFEFVKMLAIYERALDENASIILSTESEFLRYLDGFESR